jgi:predicted nucleic acid-binding protein
MVILLDTSILIDALRNRNERRAWLANLVRDGHELATSVINLAEIYSGMRAEEEAWTKAFLGNFLKFDVNEEIAEAAGKLQAQFRLQGITRSLSDLLIAATAMNKNIMTATDNQKDFQIPGLNLFALP